MLSEKDLLLAAYDAFNARDLDAALATMQPDVDWPNGMDGGRVPGRTKVGEYWTRQWAILNPHVSPLSFVADEAGNIVVDVHQVVRDLAGIILMDQIVLHVYTIQNGLIQSMEIRTPGSVSV